MKKNQPVYQSFSHANQQKHPVMLGSLRLNMDHRLHSRCHSTQTSEKHVLICISLPFIYLIHKNTSKLSVWTYKQAFNGKTNKIYIFIYLKWQEKKTF